MGAFATTLLTYSLSLLGVRDVTVEAIHTGNFIFVAGLGLLISGQWSMAKGDTFSYTVLVAFGPWILPDSDLSFADVSAHTAGAFYAGYGAMLIPGLGVVEAYGGVGPAYYNAMGLYVLRK
jgi:succinate-acetate transporter protein